MTRIKWISTDFIVTVTICLIRTLSTIGEICFICVIRVLLFLKYESDH
jgi:hypothetical protein